MKVAARWVLFCEAAADAKSVRELVDGVLRLRCAPWVAEQLELDPDTIRQWISDAHTMSPSPWFDLHAYARIAARLEVRLHHGHFGDEAQQWGSVMLDATVRIVRKLNQLAPEDSRATALVVLWDADDQGSERRAGVEQALRHGQRPPAGVEVVVALAHPEREAWLLAGFVAANANERNTLASLRSELGFAPDEQPEQLLSKKDTDKRSAKRVLAALTGSDPEREEQCVRIPDEETLSRLKSRGRACGLTNFLEQVEAMLVPQVDPTAPSRVRRQMP